LGRSVTADEECRYRGAKLRAQPLDRRDAAIAVSQPVVGDDEIGPAGLRRKSCQRVMERVSGHQPAAPALQKAGHAVEYQRIVIDDDNELVERRIDDRSYRRGLSSLDARGDARNRDGKARTAALDRIQADRMAEQSAQALD